MGANRAVLDAPHDRHRGVTAEAFRVARSTLLEHRVVAEPRALTFLRPDEEDRLSLDDKRAHCSGSSRVHLLGLDVRLNAW